LLDELNPVSKVADQQVWESQLKKLDSHREDSLLAWLDEVEFLRFTHPCYT